MENNFELKGITAEKEADAKRYVLKFTDGKTQETITLSGQGKVKEAVKI